MLGNKGGGVLGEEDPDEDLGKCPDWYITITAAKYLGVAPWDLIKQPYHWTDWAIESQQAEAKAEQDRQKRNAPKIKHSRKGR
jgi:hypothetical protein